MESGYPLYAEHAELGRRSVYHLRLKAVEMLRSGTQLVKSHGDNLSLEYLWKGMNTVLWKQFESSVEKNAEYGGQPENLSPSACYRETNHCSL